MNIVHYISGLALCATMLTGCDDFKNHEAMTNQQMSDAVKECKRLGLGIFYYTNSFSSHEVWKIQCRPE